MLSDMITTFTIDELPAEGVDKLAQASPYAGAYLKPNRLHKMHTDHLSSAREQALGAINGLRVDSASATAMEDCVRLLAEGAPAPRGGLRARELRCKITHCKWRCDGPYRDTE